MIHYSISKYMLNDELKNILVSEGASLVGWADLGEIASGDRDSLPYGVSIAVALDAEVMSEINDGPTRAYYDEYSRLNSLLSYLGQTTETFISEKGYRAVSLHPTFGHDKNTLATTLPHKTVATRAGLGWIGKCALLVTPKYGSAVRLITVLTDAPIAAGQPVNESRCGDCFACVELCPAHAISGISWRSGLPRESLYDAFACSEKALELAEEKIEMRITLCGRCIVACPRTKKYLGDD
jgi:epoxyqueuosine reductase QueG